MITAAADGSSLSNPGPAGWAWYVDETCWAAGGWPHGTNNMGELMAVLDLLRQTASSGEELHVLCDSQYVINSVSKWMPGWKRRGWRKGDGKPVLNLELFQEIDREIAGRRVTFEWVKGHAGHAMNEAADVRARAAATAFRDGKPVDHGPGFSGQGGAPAAAPMSEPSAPPAEPATLFDDALFDDTLFGDGDTAPAVGAFDEVVQLEKALLDPAVRADRERVAELLHPEFVEVGASGRQWTRGRMLASIAPLETPVRFELLDAEPLGEGTVLLRWRSSTGSRSVLRASVWQRTTSGWRLRYHQGTPTA